MARLTWQNVDDPNFSGVANSYRTMSDLLANATASGSKVLDTITNANAEAADRAILQRTLGLQDPAAYNAALADGSVVGADGSRASLATLRGLDTRVGALIDRATATDALGRQQFDNQRYIAGQGILDANADQINTARSLAASGRYNEGVALLGSIKGLRADQYAGILGDAEKSAAGALGRDVTSQGLTQQRFNFGNQVTDDASMRAGRARVAEILAQFPTAEAARPALLEAVGRGDISADVLHNTLAGAAQYGYGNILAPFGAGGGGAPAGASGVGRSPISSTGNAYDTVFGDTARGNGYGFAPPKPISSMTIGEAADYGKNVMIPATKGRIGKGDLGTSAVGAYQFVSSTLSGKPGAPGLAEQVFGKDWRNVQMTPENQDRMAQRLFEQNKNGNLQATWEGLPDSRPGAYAKMSWDQVKNEILKHEVGVTTNPSATESDVVTGMINQAVTERTSQNNATGITPNYDALLTDTRTVSDVVDGLVNAETGVYRGSDRGDMTRAINYLIKESGGRVNAAIAGEMLARNSEENDTLIGSAASWIADYGRVLTGNPARTRNQPGGVRINDSAVYAALDDYTSGRSSQRYAQNQLGAARQGENDAANAGYKTALAQYQSAVLAAGSDPRMVQQLPKYKAALDAAQARLANVRGNTNSDGTLQPDFDRTRVTPPETDTEGWQSGPLGLWKVRPSAGMVPGR